MAIAVAQQSAVAASAFGQEDAGRKDRRRVKLYRFHVAEDSDTGLEGNGGPNTFRDHSIGGYSVEPARASSSNSGGLGHVSNQLSGNEIPHDRAETAPAVMDQRDRLGALVHGDAIGNRLIAHRVEHRVARAIGHVTGAPLLRAAEVALGQQPVRFVAFRDGNLLAVDDDVTVAPAHAAPRHAPARQLAHGFGRAVDEHPDDLLVGAPIAAANRVFEMNVFVVAQAFNNVGETRLHAALRGAGVRSLRRHQRKNDHVVAAPFGADADTQTGKPATNDKNVGVNDFHNSDSVTVADPTARVGGTWEHSALRRGFYARNRSSCKPPI